MCTFGEELNALLDRDLLYLSASGSTRHCRENLCSSWQNLGIDYRISGSADRIDQLRLNAPLLSSKNMWYNETSLVHEFKSENTK
jgi:hypothetical protein